MIKILLLTFFVVSATARHFNNPVIDGADYPDPGVIFYNGQYYAVTTTNNGETDKYPIHVSNNLQDWTQVGFVFNAETLPSWSNKDMEFWAPEIHQIGENEFRVYFTSRDVETKALSIGVASSNNILGPYRATSRPLQLDLTQDQLDATLVQDNGQLYLIWKGREWMYGNVLNADGLSFASDNRRELFRNDLPWEEAVVEAPWVVKHNNEFIMFYSGNGFCGDRYAVGVARAPNPLGPWTKRGDPILTTNDMVVGPGHCSVVKDVDGVSDVMVFHGFRPGQVCVPFPRIVWSQSVGWGSDGWPYMVPN